jgi:hypothetical protein
MSTCHRAIPFIKLKAVWTKLPIAIFQGTLLLSFAGAISVCAELASKKCLKHMLRFWFVRDLLINKLIPFLDDTLL